MRFRQAILKVNGKTHLLQPNRANTFEEIYADFQQNDEGLVSGTRYSVFLHPKQDVLVEQLQVQFDLPLPETAQFFANGYQSWSESRWYNIFESIPRLRPMLGKRFRFYGDEHIQNIPRGKGCLHSWTYTVLKGGRWTMDDGRLKGEGLSTANLPSSTVNRQPSTQLFVGSLNERTGFTLLLYDQATETLTVRKDLDNLHLRHSFPALDFWVAEGAEKSLFDAYFKACEILPPKAAPNFGWTSSGPARTKISEAFLLQQLDSFDHQLSESLKLSGSLEISGSPYFQIDDGWQTTVGDWLSARPNFPNGMAQLAQKIKEKNLRPGLWIAPFVATPNSELARRHPEWLLKNPNGQAIRAGWNPAWSGWYHALDFYHDGVREYLSGVFHTMLDKWGFELLKLDFLFAVALAPPPGKTRGGVMWEAMDFLRNLMGSKPMLASGVPLGACFGLADYCRIGGNVHLSWENPWPRFLRFRERADTKAALRSSLSRWQLNGQAFQSAPDAFSLRNKHQKLSLVQQHTILTINVLLGNLWFTSDDVAWYSAEQVSELEEALLLRGSKILEVSEIENDLWKIDFEQEGGTWFALCNLTKKEKNLQLPNGSWAELRPFETLVLKS